MLIKPSPVHIIVMAFLLAAGCVKYPANFLKEKNKLIAIQPLGDFDTLQLSFIREKVIHFYNRPVIVLAPIAIPPGYIVSQSFDLYAGDSILKLLSTFLNDTVTEVVGITHADICTMQAELVSGDQAGVYGIKKIFGIGFLPGKVCVISDHGLINTDSSILQHRIMTVILHEMGHNLGLTHCPFQQCLMSDANGKTAVLDKNENYYCDKCKRKLK